MNIIDFAVLFILLLYVLNGLHKGFLASLLNLGGLFFSWLGAFLCYPLLSRAFAKSDFFSSFRFYIEGAEKVNNYEMVNVPVSSLSSADITSIMEKAKLSSPYYRTIMHNLETQAFAKDGLTTVGEYFDMTIYCVILNILAFLLIFLLLRVLFTLLTNAYSYSRELPQLSRFDALSGGSIALLRGFFSMHVVFMVIPMLLILMPVTQLTDLLNSSFTTSLFYSHSAILPFIMGRI